MQFTIRPIEPRDDLALANIIRTVMPEFACSGPGYAMHDPEVDALSAAYPGGLSIYLVVERDGIVEGGGGFGPLAGVDRSEAICELRKMYFLPTLRGLGAGRTLLARLTDAMRIAGFRRCYLETVQRMERANRLYRAAGFERAPQPLGATGHGSCDTFYVLDV